MSKPGDPFQRKINDCDCCEGTRIETPQTIENRPGLNAIGYRAGKYPQFRHSMMNRLSTKGLKPLHGLTTRDDDDFSLSLIDAWAMVADVLTFYQERIINESYLRTATERFSVLELARLIGYNLCPGVAAQVDLAFTVEDSVGSPGYARITKGIQVQSIPGPGEEPQVFETTEESEARAAWNCMKPRLTETQVIRDKSDIYITGMGKDLHPGDPILFIDRTCSNIKRIISVFPDSTTNSTRVILSSKLKSRLSGTTHIYIFKQKAALFGYNAPEWKTMPDSIKAAYNPEHGLTGEYFNNSNLTGPPAMVRVDPQIAFNWNNGSPDPKIIQPDNFSIRWKGWIEAPSTGYYTFYVYADDGIRLWIDDASIIDEWYEDDGSKLRQGGRNLEAGNLYPIKIEYYENTRGAKIQLKWTCPGETETIILKKFFYHTLLSEWPGFTLKEIGNGYLYLDALYSRVVPGSYILLTSPYNKRWHKVIDVMDSARSAFTLNSKTTRLTLKGEFLKFNDQIRETTVYVQSEEVFLAESPLPDTLEPNTIDLSTPVPDLRKGQRLWVSGLVDGVNMSEIVELSTAVTATNPAQLVFKNNLKYHYKRKTVTINGNVVRATHGETRTEILGNGDASQTNQRFPLRYAPLTYVAADTPSGSEACLSIRINDLLWKEVPRLFGTGPKERIYSLVRSDDEKTRIQFGDGINGARLPTGRENIQAIYRSGLGHSGLVDANRLTLFLTRPDGIKAVTNPEKSADAANPETITDARKNAPLTVLTLERVVSLQDYEDYSRAFPGVAKAMATWIWDGEKHAIFISIIGPNGTKISDTSPILTNLVLNLKKYGDPGVSIRVGSIVPIYFTLSARIVVSDEFRNELVLREVEQALRHDLSFESREPGQPVLLSEMYGIIQNVEGVTGAVVTKLFRKGESDILNERLIAAIPRCGSSGDMSAGEILILDTKQPPDLGVM